MSNEQIVTTLVSVLISSIFAPLIMLAVNKRINKPSDQNQLIIQTQEIASQAVDDLAKEVQKRVSLEIRVRDLETKINAPVRVTLDLYTFPDLRIIKAEAQYLTVQENSATD